MERVLDELDVVQNIGLADRAVRVVIGLGLLAGMLTYFTSTDDKVTWQAYLGLFAVYPLMSGILGWCPLYALTGSRSCSLSEDSRNQCGTVLYQIDAAMGHHPRPDHEYDHSLAGSHR